MLYIPGRIFFLQPHLDAKYAEKFKAIRQAKKEVT